MGVPLWQSILHDIGAALRLVEPAGRDTIEKCQNEVITGNLGNYLQELVAAVLHHSSPLLVWDVAWARDRTVEVMLRYAAIFRK